MITEVKRKYVGVVDYTYEDWKICFNSNDPYSLWLMIEGDKRDADIFFSLVDAAADTAKRNEHKKK